MSCLNLYVLLSTDWRAVEGRWAGPPAGGTHGSADAAHLHAVPNDPVHPYEQRGGSAGGSGPSVPLSTGHTSSCRYLSNATAKEFYNN